MEGQTDKINYRVDVQLDKYAIILKITKPFSNINKNILILGIFTKNFGRLTSIAHFHYSVTNGLTDR